MKKIATLILATFALGSLFAGVTVNYEGPSTYVDPYVGEEIEVEFDTITLVNDGDATSVTLAIDHTAMPDGWMGQWCDDFTCAPWFLDEWTIDLAANSEYPIYIHVFVHSAENFPFSVTFSGDEIASDVNMDFLVQAGEASTDVVTVGYPGAYEFVNPYVGEEYELELDTITLTNSGAATSVTLAIDHTAMPDGWMGQWCDDFTCAPWFLDEWTIDLAADSVYPIYIHVFIHSAEGFPFTVTLSGDNMEADVTYDFEILEGVAVSEDVATTPSILSQNYPNPFNPTTNIAYSVPAGASGSMKIFNIKGEVVKTFANLSGDNNVTWNGNDNSGKAVSSGIYYYGLNDGTKTITKKMILMK